MRRQSSCTSTSTHPQLASQPQLSRINPVCVRYFHLRGFIAIIHSHNCRLRPAHPRVRPGLLSDRQILKPPMPQSRCLGSQRQQFPHMFEYFLLLRCPPRRFKRVPRVPFPSSRKVSPVIRIFSARHPDLISVVDHWRPSDSQEIGKGEFQLRHRRSRLIHEPRHIMQPQKRHQTVRSRIITVFRQCLGCTI